MKPVHGRALLILGFFFFVSMGEVRADNGEYVAPDVSRRPPTLTPPSGGGRNPRRPITSPAEIPRVRGVPTPGSLVRPAPTATPGSVERSEAIPWTVFWELLRRGEPAPSPSGEAASRAGPALLAALRDENLAVRSRAALTLGRWGWVEETCAVLTGDLAPSVALLAPGLAARGRAEPEQCRRVVEVLGVVLQDPKASISARAMAAISIGLTGREGAVTLLNFLRETGDPTLRTAVLAGLGFSGHPGARDLLVSEVLPAKGGTDDPHRRALLLSALARIPGEDVTRDLLRRLTDTSGVVRAAAALCLTDRIPESPSVAGAVRALARTGGARPRSAALVALARAGDRELPALARRVLGDPTEREGALAAVAALALGLWRSSEDGPGLVRIFADQAAGPDLRAAAAVAAGLCRGRGSTAELREALGKARDPKLRAWGLVGLALLDGAGAVVRIRSQLLARPPEGTRRILMTALGRAGGMEAAALLEKGLGDSYFVNRAAAAALFRVAPERGRIALTIHLSDAKNANARRFAAIAFGQGLDPRCPSLFREILLGAGLSFRTPIERLFLYLESEILFGASG